MMQQYKPNNSYILIQGLSYLYWFLSIFKYHLIKESILTYLVHILSVCLDGKNLKWYFFNQNHCTELHWRLIAMCKILLPARFKYLRENDVHASHTTRLKKSGQQLKVIPIRYFECYCNNGSCFLCDEIKPLLDFLYFSTNLNQARSWKNSSPSYLSVRASC